MKKFNEIDYNFINAELELDIGMDLAEVKNKFKSTFGLTLRIYDLPCNNEPQNANMSETIANNQQTRQKGIRIKAYDKVSDVESELKNYFGVKVLITSYNDAYFVDSDIKLYMARHQ